MSSPILDEIAVARAWIRKLPPSEWMDQKALTFRSMSGCRRCQPDPTLRAFAPTGWEFFLLVVWTIAVAGAASMRVKTDARLTRIEQALNVEPEANK